MDEVDPFFQKNFTAHVGGCLEWDYELGKFVYFGIGGIFFLNSNEILESWVNDEFLGWVFI